MSLGINLGAQNLGTNAWKYVSPIFVTLIMVYLSQIYRESMVWWIYRGHVPDANSWRIKFMKNMEFGLKWVHIGRHELVLRLDAALWLPNSFKPLRTPKRAIKIKQLSQKALKAAQSGPWTSSIITGRLTSPNWKCGKRGFIGTATAM